MICSVRDIKKNIDIHIKLLRAVEDNFSSNPIMKTWKAFYEVWDRGEGWVSEIEEKLGDQPSICILSE